MYQPYPGSAEMPAIERKPLPPSMLTAVRVMYAGAASSLIGILVDVLTVGATAPLAAAAKGYAAVVWLIGLVAIVFLWRGPSSAYFTRASR